MAKWHKGLHWLALCCVLTTVAHAGIVRRQVTSGEATETLYAIETPAPGATVFGIVEVRGWVADPRGVSQIRLLIDGNPGNVADINLPREDVRRKYPGFFGEGFPHEPGFRTSFLASQLSDGEHTLALEVTFAAPTGEGGQPAVAVLGLRTITVDNTRNQPPLGDLDSPRDPAKSGSQDYLSGVYPITGWALDDQGIRTAQAPDGRLLADIEVMVDGRVVGQALYPLPRPDVANAFPDVPGAASSGFLLYLDTTRWSNGMHTLAVRAWDVSGESRVLAERSVWFDNNAGSAGPVGALDWPPLGAKFYAKACENHVFDSDEYLLLYHHFDWISGWVLDTNDNQQFEGVVAVELLLNGVSVKKTDAWGLEKPCAAGLCAYGPRPQLPMVSATGPRVDANMYGLERPDVAYQFPNFGYNARYSGFLFVIDTNFELFGTKRLRPGLNHISILVHRRDSVTPFKLVDQRPIYVTCDTGGNVPPVGNLDAPRWQEPAKGLYNLKGWVVDPNSGITRLNFYVDGVLDGSLVVGDPGLGLPSPDVKATYPWLPAPFVDNARFEYVLDTRKYVDGLHTITVEAVDGQSFMGSFVQRQVIFDNPN